MTARNRSVLLAAGGTGGHLFPAFALAEELGRRGIAVDLVTDMRGDRYGTGFPARQIYQVPSATPGSKKNPVALARTGVTLARGIMAARKLLRDLKPAAVMGFGGYPTIPPLVAAGMLGVPSALHEQNAVLGRANRLLAKRADALALSFAKTKHAGWSARGQVTAYGQSGARCRHIGFGRALSDAGRWGPIRLLVFGGSQGARYFSDAVPPALAALPAEIRQRLQVVQQAREEDVVRVKAALKDAGIEADVAPFFKDLPQRMAQSHLVIARAGASSVAELAAIGRPSILVPLPHSLDSDQLENATNLAESGASWCIEQKRAFTGPAGSVRSNA